MIGNVRRGYHRDAVERANLVGIAALVSCARR